MDAHLYVDAHTLSSFALHRNTDQHAHRHADLYRNTHAVADTIADGDGDAHADRIAHAHEHRDKNLYAYRHAHAERHADDHLDPHPDTFGYGVSLTVGHYHDDPHTDDHTHQVGATHSYHTYCRAGYWSRPASALPRIRGECIARTAREASWLWYNSPNLTGTHTCQVSYEVDMNRDEAWIIVTEYTASDSLRKHMLSVEAAMRAYAPRYEGDVELWGVVGLLHDFDYERYPDVAVEGHPLVGSKILRERGVSEEIIRAILSHATEVTEVERVTPMEKTLYAVDELTGLITATALVRPNKNIADVDLTSIKKKWKNKAFAAGVDRTEIEHAAVALGVPLDEHILVVLHAMQAIAPTLSLDGSLVK